MRHSLVTALASCADRAMRAKARRFLLGLSSDELQFIAEYFGACILASVEDEASGGAELSGRMMRFQQRRQAPAAADRELKLILLREYLCRSGVQDTPLPAFQAVN